MVVELRHGELGAQRGRREEVRDVAATPPTATAVHEAAAAFFRREPRPNVFGHAEIQQRSKSHTHGHPSLQVCCCGSASVHEPSEAWTHSKNDDEGRKPGPAQPSFV
eukprot:CAMPEP_0175610362 /NCGR_PEP_ID=MMETSP0096-20121207/62746_1 /TAXON_ID=311494 /ORGANISM="Alexandrium monilatum, Strain CCMP3105" /LENGTH=106 /DNA_ID=CAMNT_0016915329 /DNA_START=289 /DNA_END=607 /DNA_ORIENTATION=-